jgi:hypothetical protein
MDIAQFKKSRQELWTEAQIEIINCSEASQLNQNFCGRLGFNAKHMVDYLDNHKDPDGVRRLSDLKKLIQQPGLGMCDFDGTFITKWVRERDDMFKPHENLSERCLHQVVQDPLVFLNAKYNGEMDQVMDAYSQEHCEEAKKANAHYGQDISWFWVGEY